MFYFNILTCRSRLFSIFALILGLGSEKIAIFLLHACYLNLSGCWVLEGGLPWSGGHIYSFSHGLIGLSPSLFPSLPYAAFM